jgi:hypothetical protein
MKIHHLMMACGIMAVTMTAGSAFAEDAKALPGAACQPMSFRPTAPSGLAVGGVTISNFSTNFDTVTCPVTKDIEAGRIKRATVMVIDRNPASGFDIECTLSTHKEDGTQLAFQKRKTNSSFQTALPLEPFGAQPAALRGSYGLICSLPPMAAGNAASSIVMYNVVEE